MIVIRQSVPGMTPASLARFLHRVRRELRLTGEVNLLVSDNREMQRLNRRFRGKNKTTDVLSFPASEGMDGRLAGDIAICAPIAAANAHYLGHSPAAEMKVLVLHGLLHLAGYDHEADQGEMASKEQALRKKLGLPLGLIARSEARSMRGNR